MRVTITGQFVKGQWLHGVRFPNVGPKDAPWNVFGGYAPEEMAKPGGDG